jgi:hypothetical protein
MVKEGYEGVAERVGDMVESGKEAMGVGVERGGVVGSNAIEVTKNAEDLASKEAGHLLDNAQDMLGDKIEKVGKGIKIENKG